MLPDPHADQASNSPDPGNAPSVEVDGFALLTETLLEGKAWEYNQKLFPIWRIFDPWPEGYLLHIAGPTDAGVYIQAIWRDRAAENDYMSKIGIERYTEVARVFTEQGIDTPADLLPSNHELSLLALGPLASKFVDPGPDLDESACRQFGTTITALDIGFGALSDDQIRELWRAMDLDENMPGEMILRIAADYDGEFKESQIWISEEAANRFFTEQLAPVAETIAGTGVTLNARTREIRRLAILSSELTPDATARLAG